MAELKLLVQAGADVHKTRTDGVGAVWLAAQVRFSCNCCPNLPEPLVCAWNSERAGLRYSFPLHFFFNLKNPVDLQGQYVICAVRAPIVYQAARGYESGC